MAEIPTLENKAAFCTKFCHLPLNSHLNIECTLLNSFVKYIISDTRSTYGSFTALFLWKQGCKLNLWKILVLKNKCNSLAGLCLAAYSRKACT